MKSSALFFLVATMILLMGCRSERSISNSSYQKQTQARPWCPQPASDFAYRGELSEFDVLGIARGETASERDIQRALDAAKRVKLRDGSSILLIQSGATFPDAAMVQNLSQHFRVVPFSGVPAQPSENLDAESYAKSLRFAAARGGNDAIVCYWGMIEAETEGLATKTVSWVPIVNWLVPDERQHMRIRLKIAIIDVRSGNWSVLSSSTSNQDKLSFSTRRGETDQKLVEALKLKVYETGAQNLIAGYLE
jgi:hypothetical protein